MKRIATLFIPAYEYTKSQSNGAKPHRHYSWEIAITTKGSIDHVVNGKVYPAPVGTVMMLGPMHEHIINPIEGQPDVNVHRNLFISDRRLRACINAAFDEKFYEECCMANKPLTFVLEPPLTHLLEHQVERAQLNDSLDPKRPLLRQTVNSLIVYLLGLYLEQKQKKEQNTPEFILRFIKLLQSPDHYARRLTTLVAETGYSYSQFSQLFKKYTGRTLVEYFTEMKVKHAAHLLANTDMQILEIAMEVGYASMSSFIEKFRQIYGITPSEYRKRTLLVTPPPRFHSESEP